MDLRVSSFARVIVTSGAFVALDAGAQAQVQLFSAEGSRLLEGTWAAAVARAGDIDHDTIPDIVIGAPSEDAPGYARVVSGADLALLYEWQGDAPGDEYGCAVAGLGDTNGDGVPDIAVGACGFENGRGLVRIHSGTSGAKLVDLLGTDDHDRFGVAVEGIGDLDLDGFPDFAVGADQPTGIDGDNGYVRIYSGDSLALLRELLYLTPNGSFGRSLAGPGDTNADGWVDLVVGAPRTIIGTPKVFLFSGRWLLDSVPPALLQNQIELLYHLGASASEAGDVNADGFMDYMAGAPENSFVYPSDGAVKVYSGAVGHALHTFYGDGPVQRFGASLSGIGDVTGDGFDDLLVGAPGSLLNPVGFARVLSGFSGEPVFDLVGSADPFSNDGYGVSVASLGDLNVDGFPEFLVGDSYGEHVEVWSSVNLWATLPGTALSGQQGEPLMQVRGAMVPGKTILVGWQQLAPQTSALLVLGLSPLAAPFKGGTLVPYPDVLVGPFATGDGTFGAGFPWPDEQAIPLWLQTWVVDPSGPHGWSASAAVMSVVD